MRRKRMVGYCLLLTGTIALGGCGSDRDAYRVSGVVTVAGEIVNRGSISFVPEDGTGPSGGGIITEGRYEAMVPPGAKIVRISGFRVTGQVVADADLNPDEMMDQTAPMTGRRYNSQDSPLRATIDGDTHELDFDLEPGDVPVFSGG